MKDDVEYLYFVSYRVKNEVGRASVGRNHKISSIEHIESIEKAIAKDKNHSGDLVVTGFRLFDEDTTE